MYCDLIANDYRRGHALPSRLDYSLRKTRGDAVCSDSSQAKAEPQVLTVAELDTITAAGASVDVDTFAAAFGNDATAVTDVRTLVIDSPWVSAGIGWGVGEAVACCGPASSVDVRASVHGEGDLVRGRAVQLERDNGVLAVGVTTG